MALTDLVAASNELARILVHQELRPEQFRDATGIACKALNNLYVDPELDHALDSLQTLGERDCTDLASIINDVDHFTRHFLRRELDMLDKELKIDRRILDALRAAAADLREAVRSEEPRLVMIKQRVSSLRDEACAVSAGVKRFLDRPQQRNQVIRYALTSVGGMAAIANHTPVGLSYFSAAGAAASSRLGFGLIAIGSTGLPAKVLDKIGSMIR